MTGTPGPRWSARPWSGCATWSPQVPVDVVLVHSPDRLARKYAYQALLIEEFARPAATVISSRVRARTRPKTQLLVQFQGMIAEYERAQIIERTRRGKPTGPDQAR